MESLSEVDLGSQLLSIVIAGGLVAFALLVFRIIIGLTKIIINKAKSLFNNKNMTKKQSTKAEKSDD